LNFYYFIWEFLKLNFDVLIIIFNIRFIINMGIGDWGLGIGGLGLGAKPPNPKPQPPTPTTPKNKFFF